MAKNLLICGILSSLLYVLMNIFVPLLFEGYNIPSQTVSELSAIDAPTRASWVSLAVLYILLFTAFGLGVDKSAAWNRQLRIVARLIIVYVIINAYWPPMHLRGNEPTLTDTLQIVWAMVTLTLMMLYHGVWRGRAGKIISLLYNYHLRCLSHIGRTDRH